MAEKIKRRRRRESGLQDRTIMYKHIDACDFLSPIKSRKLIRDIFKKIAVLMLRFRQLSRVLPDKDKTRESFSFLFADYLIRQLSETDNLNEEQHSQM